MTACAVIIAVTFCAAITGLIDKCQGCDVSIMIESTQNIPGLASTEYRVASGPYNFTCQVQGATTGPLMYQWTSTCSGCAFATATDASVERTALHSNDNGTHTCYVFDSGTETECGTASIEMKIVGIGIYVIHGDESGPTGTLPNNSFVISRPDDSEGFRLRFVCRSNQTGVGQILGTGGNLLSHSSRFNVSTSQSDQPGEVLVSNRNGGQQPITSVQQGVYTCNLPCRNGMLADLSIGIYPNSFDMEPPRIISLTFDTATRSFTCTSTGSPATTVTWMRDEQPLTIDGGTYQLIQRVINRRESTYENILTLTGIEDLDVTRYKCTVMNALGDSTRMFGIICPPLSQPANGRVTVPNNRFVGSTAAYSCNAGFRRQGANTRVCMQSGQWSGVEPSCVRVICPNLNHPPNGRVATVPNNRFVGSTATYSCNAGFRRQGANTRDCMQNGQWSDVKPSCVRIICPILNHPHNGRVATVPNSRFVGSTATYTCNTGFRRQGASTRQCMESGQWSGVEPSCDRIICPTLDHPQDGRVATVPNNRFVGSTATYTCNTGFRRQGANTRQCMQSGQWSGVEPSCVRKFHYVYYL